MATARYYPDLFEAEDPKRSGIRSVVYLAVGVALVSAAGVFLVLCERDRSFLIQTSLVQTRQPEGKAQVRQMQTPQAAAPISHAESNAAPSAAGTKATEEIRAETNKPTAGAEYIPFVIPRSKHFQRLGPISIGVWRTDPRHGTYDAALLISGHRFDKKRIHMDEALAISIGDAPPMELLVNRVGRNEIAGYLSKPNHAESR